MRSYSSIMLSVFSCLRGVYFRSIFILLILVIPEYGISQFDSSSYYFAMERYELLSKKDSSDSIRIYRQKVTDQLKSAPIEAVGDWYLTQAWVYWNKSLDTTNNYLKKSLQIYTELKDSTRIAGINNNMGIIARKKGNYQEALNFYTKCAKIKAALKDTQSLAKTLNNIGVIYWNQKNHAKSMEYARKSLSLKLLINDSLGISQSYNNIGTEYLELHHLDSALYYYRKSHKIREQVKHPHYLAEIYSNIGSVYVQMYDSIQSNIEFLDSAQYYYELAKTINDTIDYPYNQFYNLNGMGQIAYRRGNAEKGMNYFQQSFELAKKLGFVKERMDAAKGAYECAKTLGLLNEALRMHEEYHKLYVEVFNEENSSQIASMESEYRYQTKHALDSLQFEQQRQVEKLEFEQKIKYQQYISIAIVLILLMIIIFALILANRLRVTRQQKIIIEETNEELNQTNEEILAQRDEIERQKEIVDLKNREITSSIEYAKRIQEAILPSMSAMDKSLKNGFVLYKPKDVVAGDFYWLEEYEGKVYFATADCTGHGVPGAMVSVVCSNVLSKVLLEEAISETGKILDKTRELVIKRLARSGEEVRDGMDISLGCIDFNTLKMLWSGANHQLLIMHNGELQTIKGDREPVGFYENPSSFTTHEIQLNKGDSIYMFTDGYVDQFGGSHGKKMGYKNFRQKIIELSTLSMTEQKAQLNSFFESWKGDEEQIDDVCVIGVEIS